MPSTNCCPPHDPSAHGHAARAGVIGAVLLLGIAVPLFLHVHRGVSLWWLSPGLLLLVHGVIIVTLAFVARRLGRIRRNPTEKGELSSAAACCDSASHEHSGHQHGDQSTLIRWPRAYDWLVWVLMFGGMRRVSRWALDLAGQKAGDNAHILDVGCGTGTLLLCAAERLGPSGTLQGVEAAAEMVAHARRKAASHGVAMDVLEGSADRLPFSARSFDVVFCTMVLHHLPEAMRADAIGEMRRVLGLGGRIVIVDIRPPRSVSAMFSLVSLFHLRTPHPLTDLRVTEEMLIRLGLTNIRRHTRGHSAIGAIVGTLP